MLKKYFSLLLLISSFVHADICQANDTCCQNTQEFTDICAEEQECPCNKPPTKESLTSQECPCNKPPKKDIDIALLETLRKNSDLESFYITLTEQEQGDFVTLVDKLSQVVQQYTTIEAISSDSAEHFAKIKELQSLGDILTKIYNLQLWDTLEQEIYTYEKNKSQE